MEENEVVVEEVVIVLVVEEKEEADEDEEEEEKEGGNKEAREGTVYVKFRSREEVERDEEGRGGCLQACCVQSVHSSLKPPVCTFACIPISP